jgi:hypothetical protein
VQIVDRLLQQRPAIDSTSAYRRSLSVVDVRYEAEDQPVVLVVEDTAE